MELEFTSRTWIFKYIVTSESTFVSLTQSLPYIKKAKDAI